MGGTWTVQNKVRAGAYINFTSVATPTIRVGSRGIGTMAIPLSWGPENEMIEVLSEDLLTGASLAKVGFTAFDSESKLLNLMLSGCDKALIYRLDTGGKKAVIAAADTNPLTVTAKYAGTFGNNITVIISAVSGSTTLFNVETYVNGIRKDIQTSETVGGLKNNDFVDFSGTGTEKLVKNGGLTLAGGTNGEEKLVDTYPLYLALARKSNWQTMALVKDNTTYAKQFVDFATEMRDNNGKYVQVVVANYAAADVPGVINSDCGATVNGVVVTADEATAWVAGITAGAAINVSNTGKVFSGATVITESRDNAKIIEAINSGMFILSMNSSGQVVVEKDINSLHTFTPTLGYQFSKNRVIRTLDEIGNTVTIGWDQSFLGKVSNNEQGRMMFKAEIISYLRSLEKLSAITNFNGADDITVTRGTDIDAVLCDLYVQPVDSMEKLYMTVTVGS